jgi:hypothetical protein
LHYSPKEIPIKLSAYENNGRAVVMSSYVEFEVTQTLPLNKNDYSNLYKE